MLNVLLRIQAPDHLFGYSPGESARPGWQDEHLFPNCRRILSSIAARMIEAAGLSVGVAVGAAVAVAVAGTGDVADAPASPPQAMNMLSAAASAATPNPLCFMSNLRCPAVSGRPCIVGHRRSE